jgi:putative glycosyltransferase (TIGR04372 family)
MIGTGSGPGAVPMCFNKPVAYTNWGPMRQRHWFKSDIYLPKQYKLITEGRFLTLEERMSDHYGYQESISALRMLGVEVIDNSPEEIKELIIEMIENTNGIQIYSPNQKEKNQYFQAVSLKNCVYPSNISKAFIDRYMINKNTNTFI